MPPKRKSARLQLQESRQRVASAYQANNPRESDATPPPSPPPVDSMVLDPVAQPRTSPPAPPPMVNSRAAASTEAVETDEAAPQPVVLSIRCRNSSDGVQLQNRRWVQSFKSRQLGKTFPNGKIPVDWSDFHQGPATAKMNNLMSHDIGCGIRAHVPMLAPSYAALNDEERNLLSSYLMNLYDISPDDVMLWGYIDNKARAIFKDWKHDCRDHWRKYGDAVPFEFVQRPEQWDYLLNEEFKPPEKQAMCARNQSNRTVNPEPMNHCCGSKPIIYIAGEHLKEGHLTPLCAATLDAYKNCTHGQEKIVTLKRVMDEYVQHAEEDPENMVPASMEKQVDMLDTSFGVGKGTYVRGAGGAVKRPPKIRGGTQQNLKLQEAEERAKNAEEIAIEAMAEVKNLKATVQKLLDAQNGNGV